MKFFSLSETQTPQVNTSMRGERRSLKEDTGITQQRRDDL